MPVNAVIKTNLHELRQNVSALEMKSRFKIFKFQNRQFAMTLGMQLICFAIQVFDSIRYVCLFQFKNKEIHKIDKQFPH